MMTNADFDQLQGWASRLAAKYRADGDVEVVGPKHPNGATTVDVNLSRTIAQVLLWANGMLELRVIAIESGAEVGPEVHELKDGGALSEVLQHAENLIRETQGD